MTANKTRLGSGDFARRIRFEQSGNIAATDVQEAIEELDAEKAATAHAHDAADITNTPAGGIAATDVQAALNELDTEKQPVDATLTSLSALGTAADRYAFTTGLDTWAEGTITAAGRAILDDASAAAQRMTLGLGALATLNSVAAGQIDTDAVGSDEIAADAVGSSEIATDAVGSDEIAAGAVTNTELADMAEDRIKGRVTTGSGDPEDLTVTQVLDNMIGSTRGSIVFRGLSAWSILAPAASGTILTSNGAGADPSYSSAGAGSTLSDTDLRNLFVKMSQQEARRLNLVDGIVDPFAAETDVDGATSTGELYDAANDFYTPEPSTSYANAGGTGDRQSIITESTNITFDGGTISNLIDGALANNTTDAVDMPVQAVSGDFWAFDFGAGNEKYITQFRVQKSGSEDSGTHNLDGSDDGSNWTTYGTISINGAPPLTGNTSGVPKAGHRHWRVIGTSGTWGNVFIQEWEFQIAAGGTAGNMDLRSNAFTASSTPLTGRLYFEVEEIDAITINTDVIGHVSRDGGTTWTAATLTKAFTLEDGKIAYEDNDIDISGQPSGTSMKWRFQTANNKNLNLHAVALQWA